jgi:hypothetical protein
MAGKSMIGAKVDYSEINSQYTGMRLGDNMAKSAMNHQVSYEMSSHASYKTISND